MVDHLKTTIEIPDDLMKKAKALAAKRLTNGIGGLLTADRDFGRFSMLAVRNPLLDLDRA
jgi:hypothetical protein